MLRNRRQLIATDRTLDSRARIKREVSIGIAVHSWYSMNIKSLIREERSKLADNYFVNLNVLLNEVSLQHF